MVVIAGGKLGGKSKKIKINFLSFCNWLRAWWDIEQL